MDMNQLVKPYKKRLIIESLIKASDIGLFLGLCLTLVTALIFRMFPQNWYGMQLGFVLSSVISGVVCALIVGIVIYKIRYTHGIEQIAKRIDKLGLDERVSTMIEYQHDKSYVAKVQ